MTDPESVCPTCKRSLQVAAATERRVWLIQRPGQYDMRRTSHKEPGAVEYMPAAEYDDFVDWVLEAIENYGAIAGNQGDPCS